MAFDIDAFRTSFREFADSVQYPSPTIEMYGGLAEMQVSQDIWKNATTMGRNLYVAHCLAIWGQNQKLAESNGALGTFGGTPTSKSVGSASVQFDATSTNFTNRAFWNLTTYGKQLYSLVRIFGAGAIQL